MLFGHLKGHKILGGTVLLTPAVRTKLFNLRKVIPLEFPPFAKFTQVKLYCRNYRLGLVNGYPRSLCKSF